MLSWENPGELFSLSPNAAAPLPNSCFEHTLSTIGGYSLSCEVSQELRAGPGVWGWTQIQGSASLEQTKVTASGRAELQAALPHFSFLHAHTHTEPLTSRQNSEKKLFLPAKQAHFIGMGEGKEKTRKHQTLISFHGKCVLSSSSDYD